MIPLLCDNWPKLSQLDTRTTGTDGDISSGIKPYKIKGDNYGEFWYNTGKNCDMKSCEKKRFDTPLKDYRNNININVGSINGDSLNHKEFKEGDKVLLNVIFSKIDWL